MLHADTVNPSEGPPRRLPAAKDFRPDIEGLRAVAVLSVVLFHAGIPGIGGGYVGVDVFFVISGFLITGLLWREASAEGSISLRRFYGARARRLLPASALVGVVTVIASVILLPPLQVKTVSIDAITSALYVSNYWFAGSGVNYFGQDKLMTPSPFKHYWSLGVEEQFYLVWPILIILTAWVIRRGRRHTTKAEATRSTLPFVVILTLVASVSFGLSLVFTYIMPPIAYFSLPTRAWQLAVGGLVALTAVHWRRLPARAAAVAGWTGLILILLACTRLSETTAYPGTAALLPTLGAALVIGGGCAGPAHGCGRLLSLSPMGAVGRLSYSLYLWHWPVLVLAPVLLGGPLGLPVSLSAVMLAVGLAVLTLRYVENPFRFSERMRRSPRASLTLGAVATAVAVCVAAVPLRTTPSPVGPGLPVPPVAITAQSVPPGSGLEAYDAAVSGVFAQFKEAVAASADLKAVPSNLNPPLADHAAQLRAISNNGCLLILFQDQQPECASGDTTSATTVALIGDSRAAMFAPALQQVTSQRKWRLELMAKAACPIVELPITRRFNGFAERIQLCAKWRGQIMERLRAERPELVVVSSWRAYGGQGAGIWAEPGFKFYDEAWISGMSQLVQELLRTGAKVLILGNTPDPKTSAPDCLSAHLEDATVCAAPPLNAAGTAAEKAATITAGGDYADLQDLFCTPDRCPAIVGNTLVYFDPGHITREYSSLLTPAMGALADRALARR